MYITFFNTCALSSSIFPVSPRLPITVVLGCARYGGVTLFTIDLKYILF